MFQQAIRMGSRTALRRLPTSSLPQRSYHGVPRAQHTPTQAVGLDIAAWSIVLALCYHPSAYDYDEEYRKEVDQREAERMQRYHEYTESRRLKQRDQER